MKVKVCGITDVNTALAAVELGADAIGFVFAKSKRRITVERAKEISFELPKEILKIGVFVNETKEEIERIAADVGLTHIQLHGDETEMFCQSFSIPVIKAFSIESNQNLEKIVNFPCDYLLLDGPKGKYRGGNGSSFEWAKIDSKFFNNRKVILAGGLTVENVTDGIKMINPDMVDVSSGVETDGIKDIEKIKSFIQKAKGA
jgi:phosphoribosylanthranilate isomerase